MSLLRRKKLRRKKACWVQFAACKAIVLGMSAREIRELRPGWHGPWTIVTLRKTSNDQVVRTEEWVWINTAVACELIDMTVLVEEDGGE